MFYFIIYEGFLHALMANFFSKQILIGENFGIEWKTTTPKMAQKD